MFSPSVLLHDTDELPDWGCKYVQEVPIAVCRFGNSRVLKVVGKWMRESSLHAVRTPNNIEDICMINMTFKGLWPTKACQLSNVTNYVV